MYYKDNNSRDQLALYEVKELTMEEALLVLAAEKELLNQSIGDSRLPHQDAAPEPDLPLAAVG